MMDDVIRQRLLDALDAYDVAARRLHESHYGDYGGPDDSIDRAFYEAEERLKDPLLMATMRGPGPYVQALAYQGRLYAISLGAVRVVAIDGILEFGDEPGFPPTLEPRRELDD